MATIDPETYAAAQSWMRDLVRSWRRNGTMGLDMLRRTDPGIAYAAWEMPEGGVPTQRSLDHVAACLFARTATRDRASLPDAVLAVVDRVFGDIDLATDFVRAGRSMPPYLALDGEDDLFVVALDSAMQAKRASGRSVAMPVVRSLGSSGNVLSFPPDSAWAFRAAIEAKPRLRCGPGAAEDYREAIARHPAPPGAPAMPRKGVAVVDMGEEISVSFAYDPEMVAAIKTLPPSERRFSAEGKCWIMSRESALGLMSGDVPAELATALTQALGQGRGARLAGP